VRASGGGCLCAHASAAGVCSRCSEAPPSICPGAALPGRVAASRSLAAASRQECLPARLVGRALLDAQLPGVRGESGYHQGCSQHVGRGCVREGRDARRWRFAPSPERVYAMAASQNAVVLPDADARGLGRLLRQRGFQARRRPRPPRPCTPQSRPQEGVRSGLARVCTAWRRARSRRGSGRGRVRARAAAAACGGAVPSAEGSWGQPSRTELVSVVCRADAAGSQAAIRTVPCSGRVPQRMHLCAGMRDPARVREVCCLWAEAAPAAAGVLQSGAPFVKRTRRGACRAARAPAGVCDGRLQGLGAPHALPVHGALPSEARAQVFVRGGALYAFRGLGGKLGPIGVHAAMLAIMAGAPARVPAAALAPGSGRPAATTPVRPAGRTCAPTAPQPGRAHRPPQACLAGLGAARRARGGHPQRRCRGAADRRLAGAGSRVTYPNPVHPYPIRLRAGVSYGGLCGLKGSVMVPEGGDFLLSQVLAPRSMFARLPDGADAMLRVNSFDVRAPARPARACMAALACPEQAVGRSRTSATRLALAEHAATVHLQAAVLHRMLCVLVLSARQRQPSWANWVGREVRMTGTVARWRAVHDRYPMRRPPCFTTRHPQVIRCREHGAVDLWPSCRTPT